MKTNGGITHIHNISIMCKSVISNGGNKRIVGWERQNPIYTSWLRKKFSTHLTALLPEIHSEEIRKGKHEYLDASRTSPSHDTHTHTHTHTQNTHNTRTKHTQNTHNTHTHNSSAQR
jgi:hypothetical protein